LEQLVELSLLQSVHRVALRAGDAVPVMRRKENEGKKKRRKKVSRAQKKKNRTKKKKNPKRAGV
jgi:hypothetical protein